MGRVGNIFSYFKEFPPRYVPGTDISGRPVEIAFEGWLDSNYIIRIYREQYSTPHKIRIDDEEDSLSDSSKTSSSIEESRM